MPAEYRIRPVGRPEIERDASGLRKITRKYVVDGIAVTASGTPNIEGAVFLPFGTLDEEYQGLTLDVGPGYESLVYADAMGSKTVSAHLVGQKVEPAPEVTQAYLTRIYQELEATPDPVQIGQDTVKLSDGGRMTLQRVFMVRNNFTVDGDGAPDSAITPFKAHYDPTRIGSVTTTITHGGTPYVCILGGVESKEEEVFTLFTETYYEDAIISETIEYKNGLKPDHKLEIRTIKAITGSPELTEPTSDLGPKGGTSWYLVSERDGSGSMSFGQTGKPVSTRVWAKGRGIISELRQSRHNGILVVVTLRCLGFQTSKEDISELPPAKSVFNHVSEQLQESSGHQVFTDTFAAGYGLVSVSFEDKGLTQISSETWVTAPGASHGSALFNIFSTKLDSREGYDVHTLSGTTDPSGILSIRRQYKHQGALEIVSISKIGSMSTTTEFDASTGGHAFTLISKSVDNTGRYTVYSDTWASGEGTIATSVRYTGTVITTGYTALDEDPGSVDDLSVSHSDGYTIYRWSNSVVDPAYVGEDKQWLNIGVYRTTDKDVVSSPPNPLADDDAETSEGYTPHMYGIWSTSKTTITVEGDYSVLSIRKTDDPMGFLRTVKEVASEGGVSVGSTSYNTFKPTNGVLVSYNQDFLRGWTKDTFTWHSLPDGDVTTKVESTDKFTLPGVLKVVQGDDGFILESAPVSVLIPVVKKTLLTQTYPLNGDYPLVYVPSVYAAESTEFYAKTNRLVKERTKSNFVYDLTRTTSNKKFDSLYGLNTMTSDFTLSGTLRSQWNLDVINIYLGVDISILVGDGTSTIYRVDTVQGTPQV